MGAHRAECRGPEYHSGVQAGASFNSFKLAKTKSKWFRFSGGWTPTSRLSSLSGRLRLGADEFLPEEVVRLAEESCADYEHTSEPKRRVSSVVPKSGGGGRDRCEG